MADVTCSPSLRPWAGIRARLPMRSSSAGSLVSGVGSGLRRRNPVDAGFRSSICGRPGWPKRCSSDAFASQSAQGLSQVWQPSQPRSPLVAAGSLAAEGCSPRSGCESPSAAMSRSLSSPAAWSEIRVTFRRRVSTHSITPYSEVYGQHPNFFDFTRKGERVQTDAGAADELCHQEP